MKARWRWAALLTVVGLLLAGCATVPHGGEPVDYTRVADPGAQVNATEPTDGLGPQDIVRGFITANARVDQDPKLTAARSYLTTAANSIWHLASTGVMILSATPRYDTVADDPDSVQLTGTTDGYLAADGSFVPTGRQEFKVLIGVTQVDGQWRIKTPPDQLILSVGDFNLAFTQRQLYFINHTGALVVPDRRWLPNSSPDPETMADQLVSRLVGGPSTALAGAVANEFTGVRLRTPIKATADGVLQVELTGTPSLGSADARKLAAQLVYTLRLDAGKIRILVDGTPLDANQAIWTIGVLGSFDPDGVPGSGTTGAMGYLITPDGVMVTLRGVPVWGTAGTGALQGISAAMSAATGALALVGASDGGETLSIGAPITQVPMEARLTAQSFSPPSFSRAGDEVWTVINGATSTPEVLRLLTAGSRYPVDSSTLAGLGEITGLALSPDGARVAIVAGSKLYQSTVTYVDDPGATAAGTNGGNGVATLGVPQLLRSELTVTGVIWSDSQNMLVTAADPASTYRSVWRIGLDGRQRSALTTRGIFADVEAVAATGALPTLISSGGQILQLKGDDTTGEWVSANPDGQQSPGRWPVYPA